ncbi:MAG: methyltransferase domain-containing protein, partial [Candidatus Hodarchaeales archaeon]
MSIHLNYEYKDVEASLNETKELLGRYDYKAGYYQRLREGYGFIHAPRRRLEHGDLTTELLLSFFAENRSLKSTEIDILFPSKLKHDLEQANLIIRTDKEEFLSVFRIFPLNHYFLLIPFRRYTEPQVYIGAESLTFNKYIQVLKHPKKILDLASGTGFQLFGLPWQGPSYSMIGIDINPNAVLSATLTAEWNNCSKWMTFREGDITTELRNLNEKFDLITGHLPILPTPDHTRYKDTVHNDGGADGFEVIRKVFPSIPDILEDNGTFQLILIMLGDHNQPSLLTEVEQIMLANGLEAQVLAIKKLPVELDAYYRGKKDLEYKRWMDFYQKQDKTYWYR